MKRLNISRRRVLRGVLKGAAIGVALPMLDLFLNENGNALASQSSKTQAGSMRGTKLPLCFGTWFWPLGLSPGMWEPKKTGKGFELTEFLQSLKPIHGKFNLISGTQVFLDGKTLQVHYSPPQGIITGEVSGAGGVYGTSLDQSIAAEIGKRTRFRSLTLSCDGNPNATWSSRGAAVGMNPGETSPLALYTRLFGPGFADPNAAEFKPDPAIMVRQSSLSAITEQRQKLLKEVGAADRARLDAYFTSVRELENKLALELERPQPLEACVLPKKPVGEKVTTDIADVVRTHKLFNQLIGHALACGQTQVISVTMSPGVTPIHKAGDPTNNHSHSHEEPIDPKLGYQPICKSFADIYLSLFSDLVLTLDGIKEGDGTLLSRTLLMGFTDHGEARRHTATKIPMLLAGGAGGRMATGYHIAAEGDTSCRVGLTCFQALGIPVASWGTESNRTDKAFTELLVAS